MDRKTKIRRQNRRINNLMILVLMILTAFSSVMIILSAFLSAGAQEGEGEKETLVVDADRNQNKYYTIGNNPTDLQKEYFTELSDAVDSGDKKSIAESVVKSFIADYFTWSNKDGNYEVGGMEYMFVPERDNFALYSRWNFYADLDKNLKQYGREALIRIREVKITQTVPATYDYTYEKEIENLPEDGEEQTEEAQTEEVQTETVTDTYEGYRVTAEWTYGNTEMNTDGFMTNGIFTVVDNDGRMEIIAIQKAE